MGYDIRLREEEIKNKLRRDYFADYDATEVIDDIDFAVAIPRGRGELDFETEYLLWAEAKKGTSADIYESFVQLIITIGKARTFDTKLPPAFLGAFDAEKIGFIPYNSVLDVFYMNDFDWRVRPSDHTTREFRLVLSLVKEKLDESMTLFRYDTDDKELREFIRANFIMGKSDVSRVRINRNNFISIYLKWLVEVKPTIAVDWDKAKANGILDADFYLADILSEHNVTLRKKLFVLLRQDYYELDRRVDEMGLFDSKRAEFTDRRKAHKRFWNRYDRPPRREYWDNIVMRRDKLVPQDVRERKGSFFTPRQWVELSQDYLARELGENWQDEYTVWDCAAGTGNLLVGLENKYNIWASTIDKADVDAMHDRISNGANLLDSHVFQFDFLNDPFTKLPQPLQDIINDPEKRKKLVIYINPPYAEAGNKKAMTDEEIGNKDKVAKANKQAVMYKDLLGSATNEVFALFFIRIFREFGDSVLAAFSTLKMLQAPNFAKFREIFAAELKSLFIVPAKTFDNVNGAFPIGFSIYDTDGNMRFSKIDADVYDEQGRFVGKKCISVPPQGGLLMDWIKTMHDKQGAVIGHLRTTCSDFQNQNGTFLTLSPSANDILQRRTHEITKNNFLKIAISFAVRLCIPATWLNDRDQFLYPKDSWAEDREFHSDCLVYTIFNSQNRISCQQGVNHWIPFTEAEVDAQEKFKSHFMSDYIRGKVQAEANDQVQTSFFDESLAQAGGTPLEFSPEARAVMDAGRELWRYYHSQPGAMADAALYDIKMHFQGTKTTRNGRVQMAAESSDARYTELIATLRQRLKVLARKIEPRVYEHGFLRR